MQDVVTLQPPIQLFPFDCGQHVRIHIELLKTEHPVELRESDAKIVLQKVLRSLDLAGLGQIV